MQIPPRWQWKINRARQQWADRWDRTRTMAGVVKNQQRMCPSCRALVGRGENTCPMCGMAMHEVARGAVGRSMELALPKQGRVSFTLLFVNSLLFLLTLMAAMRVMEGEFSLGSLFGGIDGLTLVQYGAKFGPLIADGEWWRLVTPIFLHGGAIHLAMNSWVLYDLGPSVEGLYGRQKFLVMYVLCGIGGALGSFLWSPLSVSIGASGAIFGLIGVMIGRSYQYRGSGGSLDRSIFVRWAVYMLLFGIIIPGIDNAAHVGGLVVGLALGYVVADMPPAESPSLLLWKALQAATILLVAASFVLVRLYPYSPV
ncbi:MAG: rhomboid family intramembrane serine protease [Acidobacteria bacterium]|nr:rhomboid family intramembrane serine protease [Acidobacteriota bacterium]